MEYSEFHKQTWNRPEANLNQYLSSQKEALNSFLQGNLVIKAIEGKEFSIRHYHSLLKAIFHQVYFSSTSFALAGAMSSLSSVQARSYLLHHAEEEMNHWTWILEDLQSTGYKGKDPREEHANWAAQAYLSYGVYLSFFNPIGRLAMAQVLEGISGDFGLKYGGVALQSLKLKKEQAKFFLVHGELDQGHSHEVAEVLAQENLSPKAWGEMVHIAKTTSHLYKNIYNYAMTDGLE